MQVETRLTLHCGKLWEEVHSFKAKEEWVNRLYYCPTCGDTWARWQLGAGRWMAYRIPCQEHQWTELDYPGSILYNWKDDLKRLPPELLLRELRIHCPEIKHGPTTNQTT